MIITMSVVQSFYRNTAGAQKSATETISAVILTF